MRVIRNAKPVSIAAGGVLVVVGCLGWWHAAVLWDGQANDRAAVFTAMLATLVIVQGAIILSWDRRSKPTVLMRAQAVDALPAALPVTVFGSAVFAEPAIANVASPSLWLACLLLASVAISVVPAEKELLSEVPPLRSVGFLDWLRWQNFGAITLLQAIFFSLLYFSGSLRHDAVTPLVAMLAVVQAAVSIWRIVEHRQFSKAGARLSGMQIIWLRAVHVHSGHEAAVKELRAMYPKIGSSHADYVIENLYQTEEMR